MKAKLTKRERSDLRRLMLPPKKTKKTTRHNYSRPVVSDELMGGESATVSHRIVKPCRLEALDYSGVAFKVAVRVGRRAAKPGMRLKAGDVVKFLIERRDEPLVVNGFFLGSALAIEDGLLERREVPLPFHPQSFELGARHMLEARPQADFYIRRLLVSVPGASFGEFVVHAVIVDNSNLLSQSLPAELFSLASLGVRFGLPGKVKAGKVIRADVERPHVPVPFRATIRLSRPKVKR